MLSGINYVDDALTVLRSYAAYGGAHRHFTKQRNWTTAVVLVVNNFRTARSDCGAIGAIPYALPPQVVILGTRGLVFAIQVIFPEFSQRHERYVVVAVGNLAAMIPTVAVRPCTAKPSPELNIEGGRATSATLVVNNAFSCPWANEYL